MSDRAKAAILLLGVVAALPPPGAAQVSREQLLELTAAGTDPAVIVALVERDCVDFEVDSATLVELSGRLPPEVLEAAVECGRDQRRDTPICGVYRALDARSELADFPVVVRWFRNGDLRLLGVSTSVWLEERGVAGGLKARFRATGELSELHMAAAEAVRGLPGVRSFLFEDDPELSSADLAALRRSHVDELCAERARLRVVSDPAGAAVTVDGVLRGGTPLTVRLAPGEHSLEVRAAGHSPHMEWVELAEGERLEVAATLTRQASLAVTSEPAGAVVLVDDRFAGHSPLEVFLEGGEHRLALLHPRRRPHAQIVTVDAGEPGNLDVGLAPRSPGACLDDLPDIDAADGVPALARRLRGSELELLVPLYAVVSSTLEREIPATRVVDARRIFFAPGKGKNPVDRPERLLGRELSGLAFGETASAIVETPPGRVTVTDVERRRSSLRVELLHESGAEVALYLDFTQGLDRVRLTDVADALCLVTDRQPLPLPAP